jgi:hypothetical protein
MDIVVIPHVFEIARPNVWKELAQLLSQTGASWFRYREKPFETIDVS